MDTRALGKALGRLKHCVPVGLPERRGPVAMSLFAGALWMACAAISSEPDPGPLPAFDDIDPVSARKARFFEYLTPMVRAENRRISQQRDRLLAVARAWRSDPGAVSPDDTMLHRLAHDYRLDPDELEVGELISRLLLRVDVIPRSLVLVQAAKESGWGSSRFARRANNLFGQWCFEPGCGVVPRRRPAGMTHEVRSFESVRESVVSYMRNLNTHDSYVDLRALRARLRAAGRPLSGMRLAEGLTPYSERGDVYVQEVQSMIRQNDLESADVASAVTGS